MIKQFPSSSLPLSDPLWQQWLAEVSATGAAIAHIDSTNPNFGRQEPSQKTRGLMAYANGTDWDPGNGEGYYRWTGSAWKLVG